MPQTVKGVLKKISAKSGISKNGAWTAYSLGISINGSDDYNWFRYGFTAPPVTEGSFVIFDAEEIADKPGLFRVVGEINVDKDQTAEAPAAAARNYSGGKDSSTQDSIVRQSSTDKAIAMIDSMLTHGVITIKGTAAKKYDLYRELVTKITNELFVSNRNAASVEDLAKAALDDTEASEGASDASGDPAVVPGPPAPDAETEEDAWSPV